MKLDDIRAIEVDTLNDTECEFHFVDKGHGSIEVENVKIGEALLPAAVAESIIGNIEWTRCADHIQRWWDEEGRAEAARDYLDGEAEHRAAMREAF